MAKAAEELEGYRLSNKDKDNVEEEEAWLVQAHDRAKSRLKQLEASLSEREERLKNVIEDSCSRCKYFKANINNPSSCDGRVWREDDIKQEAVDRDQDNTVRSDEESAREAQLMR